MKKIMAIMLTALLLISLVACGHNAVEKKTTATEAAKEAATEAAKEAATEAAKEAATEAVTEAAKEEAAEAGGAALKTGLGVSFSNGNSKDPAEGKDGVVDAQVYVAAVLVDGEGKIVKCVIDSVQSQFSFNDKDEILTAPDTRFQSKNELAGDYGMKKASPIGKEWFEQAAAFAEYCLGKTGDEIKNLAVENGKASDKDLVSSVTVYVAPFQNAVVAAVEQAKELGARSGDSLGLGIAATAAKTRQKADGDKKAEAVAYNYYAVLSLNAEKKISSCLIDASQAKFTIEGGKIATALDAEIKTKNAIGADYGMKKVSSIAKEWDEQAAAFAAYTLGKTVEEVVATKLDQGLVADADLKASVTVHVSDFIQAIEKAAAQAK